MSNLLRMRGENVLFAHWPIESTALRPAVPDQLTLDTFDGQAWLGVLAFRVSEATPTFLPGSGGSTFPQLNFRTYVEYDGDAGVYFLSSDAGSGIGASIGKRLLQVPIYRAEMKLRKRGEEYSFWSRRTGRDAPAARFGAEYRPVGETFRAEPGSIEEFLIERTRYFVPDGDERAATDPSLGASAMQVGTLERDPWTLQDVEANIETNTLFQAAGIEPPTNSPLFHYSPSFELTSTPPRPQGRS